MHHISASSCVSNNICDIMLFKNNSQVSLKIFSSVNHSVFRNSIAKETSNRPIFYKFLLDDQKSLGLKLSCNCRNTISQFSSKFMIAEANCVTTSVTSFSRLSEKPYLVIFGKNLNKSGVLFFQTVT